MRQAQNRFFDLRAIARQWVWRHSFFKAVNSPRDSRVAENPLPGDGVKAQARFLAAPPASRGSRVAPGGFPHATQSARRASRLISGRLPRIIRFPSFSMAPETCASRVSRRNGRFLMRAKKGPPARPECLSQRTDFPQNPFFALRAIARRCPVCVSSPPLGNFPPLPLLSEKAPPGAGASGSREGQVRQAGRHTLRYVALRCVALCYLTLRHVTRGRLEEEARDTRRDAVPLHAS